MRNRKSGRKDLYRRVHRWRLRLLRLPGEPDQIARGVALGMFLGFVLPPGTQTIVAVGLAPIFRSNPIAAAAAVWITNPVTMPLIYPAALVVGAFLTGQPIRRPVTFADEQSFWKFLIVVKEGGRAGFLMWTGLLVFGSVAAFVCYYLVKWLAARYRKMRQPTQPQP